MSKRSKKHLLKKLKIVALVVTILQGITSIVVTIISAVK